MSEDHFVSLPSGCRLCYRVSGNPSDPAFLIFPGSGVAMTQKTGDLVRLLSPPDHPYCVVQFDSRDTGLSTSFPRRSDGERAYGLDDLVDDALGLITHLKLNRVHLIGMSMGGPLAWLTASRLPNVVRSLALVCTSPVGRIITPADNLPPIYQEGSYLLGDAFELPDDLDDEDGWIETYMRVDLALATQPPTEEERAQSRSDSEVTYRREKESGTMWTKSNHSGAASVRWPREELRKVACPTVVIHAAKDQFFPLEHPKALRDDVEGATLVVIEDCGHEIPSRIRPILVDAILTNARKGEDAVVSRD